MRNRKYLLSGIFIILYVALLFTMFSYAKGPFIFNGEIFFSILSSIIILILMGIWHWMKISKKSVNKKFVYLIISELVFIAIFYVLQMAWSTPCDTPDFFHPFGKILESGHLCIQVIARAPSPFFYFGLYALTFTIILYIGLLLRNKSRKTKK